MGLSEQKYEPRPQFAPFHERNTRWTCIVAHRRAGKTVACVNELVTRALYSRKQNPRYAYIAPFYRQAKEVAWEYLKYYAEPFCSKVSESALSVTLVNGAKISLFGADNPDALRGLYFDGVVIDEYGDTRPSLWGSVVLPTLADRRGWAVFIGTPKGKNHFYDIAQRAKKEKNWTFCELKASQTGILPDEELAEMRAQMSEEEYRQEMECDFTAAVLGTYYAAIIERLENTGHMKKLDYDPEFPVEVSSDLGYSDSSAMWFWQVRPDGIAMIDYEEAHGEQLSYYFEMLKFKRYKYETIWLPHDARAKSLQTGRSTVEQFLNEGFPARIAPKLSVQHGIDAARLILPQCYFDTERCQDGIEALRAYRRKYDEVLKAFSPDPLHDWSSDGADAFRYFALVTRDKFVQIEQKKEEKKKRDAGWMFTGERDDKGRLLTNIKLDEIWDTRPVVSRRI